MRNNEKEKWNQTIFGSTVSGRIINFYSKENRLVDFYNFYRKEGIGSKPIFEEMIYNRESKYHFVLRSKNDNRNFPAIYFEDPKIRFYRWQNFYTKYGNEEFMENVIDILKECNFG
jgi:hypothetical protein